MNKRRRASQHAPAVDIVMNSSEQAVPLYVQLYQQLRDHILSKQLAPGSLLPSARVLAGDLNLSRNTVEAAINQLRAEGFVARRVGAGTVVADIAGAVPFFTRKRAIQSAPLRSVQPSGEPPHLSELGGLISREGANELAFERNNAPTTVDVLHFPTATWNRLVARAAREKGTAALDLGDPQGDPSLRRAISEHAHLTRGLRCTPGRVVILSSAQQGLDLASRLLLDNGDKALVEEPGYRSARAAFRNVGAAVQGIPVDSDGIVTDALAHHLDARLLYLTPSHQYPLGVTMRLQRRLSALSWARQCNAWIIEDDYDSEFRHRGRPLAALQGLDQGDHVLYLGTFNKVMFPALRIAYLILPESLVPSFVAARRLTDGGPATLSQSALALFLVEGHFAAHLRRARKLYTARRDVLARALRREVGEAVTVGSSETGLHLVAHLPPDIDDVRIANAIAGTGLGVAALSSYYAEQCVTGMTPRGLLIAFGGATDDGIRSATAALRATLR